MEYDFRNNLKALGPSDLQKALRVKEAGAAALRSEVVLIDQKMEHHKLVLDFLEGIQSSNGLSLAIVCVQLAAIQELLSEETHHFPHHHLAGETSVPSSPSPSLSFSISSSTSTSFSSIAPVADDSESPVDMQGVGMGCEGVALGLVMVSDTFQEN